uniref:Uncharacterized protein n=1 Tax=Ditylenchus dipsaci TaxID=166011 RepID=A0A915DUF9_9BILA
MKSTPNLQQHDHPSRALSQTGANLSSYMAQQLQDYRNQQARSHYPTEGNLPPNGRHLCFYNTSMPSHHHSIGASVHKFIVQIKSDLHGNGSVIHLRATSIGPMAGGANQYPLVTSSTIPAIPTTHPQTCPIPWKISSSLLRSPPPATNGQNPTGNTTDLDDLADQTVLIEARNLRLHQQRLEQRSRVLEDQNRQLQQQLERLNRMVDKQKSTTTLTPMVTPTSCHPQCYHPAGHCPTGAAIQHTLMEEDCCHFLRPPVESVVQQMRMMNSD